MKKTQAKKVLNEFKAIIEKYGLWNTITTEGKPDLKMIRIKEICIKVDD